MAKNYESEFRQLIHILSHAQSIEIDWWGVLGTEKSSGDRGPPNRR